MLNPVELQQWPSNAKMNAFSLKPACNLQIVCLTLHPDNLHVLGFESGFPKLLFDTRSHDPVDIYISMTAHSLL